MLTVTLLCHCRGTAAIKAEMAEMLGEAMIFQLIETLKEGYVKHNVA